MESLNVNTEELDKSESPDNTDNSRKVGDRRSTPTANVDMDALAARIVKQLNGGYLLKNLAGLGLSQSRNDSSPDLDLDMDLKRIGKEKGWRSKMEKDPDKVIKNVIKSSRGGNLIERLMIEGYNNDINVSNIYKNGNIELRVPNLVPFLAKGVMGYIRKQIDNENELEDFKGSLGDFYDKFLTDCVLFVQEETLDLLKKLYVDVREDRDCLNVADNNLRLRNECLNTQRRPFKRRNNNFSGGNNNYNSGRNSKRSNAKNKKKRLCLDWNKKGKCSYPNCRYPHECSGCGSDQHGSVHCKEANEDD